MLALLFYHKQRVIKQVQLQIAAVPLDTTSFVQSTFVDELATFFLQTQVLERKKKVSIATFLQVTLYTYYLLSLPEHELLVQLEKIEPVLCSASLNIDFAQEVANEADDLR